MSKVSNKSYLLSDPFDGRCIHLISRVSCRKVARKAAAKFMKSYYDQANLIEVVFNLDGSITRNLVHNYKGK